MIFCISRVSILAGVAFFVSSSLSLYIFNNFDYFCREQLENLRSKLFLIYNWLTQEESRLVFPLSLVKN